MHFFALGVIFIASSALSFAGPLDKRALAKANEYGGMSLYPNSTLSIRLFD